MTNSTTKVYDEALQERVRKYMKDTGLSQNKLAPRIGMSGASLSNYMNCKMDGSVEGIESRLREFLQQESEAAAVQVQVAPYKLDETYKPTAEEGAHDDCVMALAIAHAIRPQQSYLAQAPETGGAEWDASMWEDYDNASPAEREYLIKKWGRPK